MDTVEVQFPAAAAVALRGLAHAPVAVRRRVLLDAFARAERAFNRGDLAVVFALFAADVEYVPPPPLYDGPAIIGRESVHRFWDGVLGRYEVNTIRNLSVEETSPERFVRTAELKHSSAADSLAYTIRQTTELKRGRVARQINVLASASTVD